ncbi:fibronectin type III domain-containing protein [bacterium]|nr:fibronectin type III domain-containing protein [bacterium]MDC0362253.1 fibronectin type III domain-containing protein [Halioglobus sp.]
MHKPTSFYQRPLSTLMLGLAVLLSLPEPTAADTYQVTSSSCNGPGSFREAVAAANTNPGPDTVSFSTDITNVKNTSCGLGTVAPDEAYIVLATDDLVIEGNGHSILGGSLWIAADGNANVPGVCPRDISAKIVSEPLGLVRLANGVSVTVNDLNLDKLRAIADLDTGSDLTVNRVTARRTFDFVGNCDTSAILLRSAGGSNVTINDSLFSESWNQGFVALGNQDGSQAWLNAFINGPLSAGTLTVSGSTFATFVDIPAIQWDGTVNILSTQFRDSGFVNIRGGTAKITNSILMSEQISQQLHDRIMASGGSSLLLEASTVAISTPDCPARCMATTGTGAIVATDNATIELKASAMSVGIDAPELLIREATGGNVTATADPNPNWIQPTSGQNATVLRAILNQPALLTNAPGLPNVAGQQFVYQAVTPLIDDGGGTLGLLIDAVTDASTTNVLTSPIDGSPVTEDIFGNPRTEAAGTVRDIGAVQLSLATTVSVSSPSAAGATVVWTRPKDPDPAFPIIGYGVIVEPTDGSMTPVRIDVVGADNLTLTLTGLAPGSEYRVTVVAVNANGDGPPSNMPSFTTLPPPAAPAVAVPAMPPWALLFLVIAILAMGKREWESKYQRRLSHRV